jgi:uncharacterized membrane protein YGL010W
MSHDAIIQWLATLFVFGWIVFFVCLSGWLARRDTRLTQECRALKEAREIVEQQWNEERV